MAAAKKPVMDVSKPGETPADATSRPIISGHAVLKDPMVNATESETEVTTDALAQNEEAPKEAVAPSAAHKIIKPLEAEASDTAEQEEPASETEQKSEESDSEVSDGAVVDAVLDQVTDKKKQEAVDVEEQKRQELVEKLVEDKKYFVPIGQERSRRNNRLFLLLLGALLPVVVGLGLAADAGAINLGFKVPFDFIKDKPAAVQQSSTPQPVVEQPATRKITGKLYNFSIVIPSNWPGSDTSDAQTGALRVSFSDSTSDNAVGYTLIAPVGNMGRCTPAKTDTPHAAKNLCPTYEETALTETQYGYILTTKYTVLGKTTSNLCFRAKTSKTGETIVMTQANLNKPVMGPYDKCGEGDMSIEASNTKAEVLDVFKQSSYNRLLEALKTVTFTYSKS